MAKKKVSKLRVLRVIAFLVGLILCSYPLVSNLIQQQYQRDAVATYRDAVSSSGEDSIEVSLEDAIEYNDALYQSNGLIVGTSRFDVLSDENYNKLLNVSNNGIMGSVEIPKINVNLPIYHGTSDEVLAVGVGHVQESSLPIGGINTRTILTGHRGLPNSKLFTRLDELEKGDLFFIKVLNETLAYEVVDIEVIKPSEINKLAIMPERDLATLLTCTPYGINSHRLIVTGERVEFVKAEYEAIESETMSLREIVFALIPVVFALFGVISVIRFILKSRKKSRLQNRKKGVDDGEVKNGEED